MARFIVAELNPDGGIRQSFTYETESRLPGAAIRHLQAREGLWKGGPIVVRPGTHDGAWKIR